MPTLEELSTILGQTKTELASYEEQGHLFLFRAVTKTLVEMFRAQDLTEVKRFLTHLKDNFPFGRSGQRLKMQEDLGIVLLALEAGKITEAQQNVRQLYEDIRLILMEQAVSYLQMTSRSRGWKVKHQGRGTWKINSAGYRRTPAGLLRKEASERYVRTPELISMIEHVVSTVTREREANLLLLAELEQVKQQLPEGFELLYEMHLKLAKGYASIKDVALVSLLGAMDLTVKDPAEARTMLSDVEQILNLRQEQLEAQKQRYVDLRKEVEPLLGKELKKFSEQIVRDMLHYDILFDVGKIEAVDERLGGYLGTFLKGKMREPWLKQSKSKVYGVKKALTNMANLLRQKQHFIEQTMAMREVFRERHEHIWQSRMSANQKQRELARLKAETLSGVRDNLTLIMELNKKLVEDLGKAAIFMLSLGLIFANREAEVVDEAKYFEQKESLLRPLDRLLLDQVEVIDTSGESLGQALREDARSMELTYR